MTQAVKDWFLQATLDQLQLLSAAEVPLLALRRQAERDRVPGAYVLLTKQVTRLVEAQEDLAAFYGELEKAEVSG